MSMVILKKNCHMYCVLIFVTCTVQGLTLERGGGDQTDGEVFEELEHRQKVHFKKDALESLDIVRGYLLSINETQTKDHKFVYKIDCRTAKAVRKIVKL